VRSRRGGRAGRNDEHDEECCENSEEKPGHESSFREGFGGVNGARKVF
jgi:hypothetical protein